MIMNKNLNDMGGNESIELTLSLDTPFFEMVIPNATITITGNNIEKVISVGSAEKITLTKGSKISQLSRSSTSVSMIIDGYSIEFNSNSPMKFMGTYSFIYDDTVENPLDSSKIFDENLLVTVSTILGSTSDYSDEMQVAGELS